MKTLEEIEASLKPGALAFYSARCAWWTTDSRDLGETSGKISLPCCPYCEAMLFQAPARDFIASAKVNPSHYGAGGLSAFANAHHSNGKHARSWTDMRVERIRFQQRPPSVVKSMRCIVCASEFSEAETVGADACPSCGRTGVPAAISDDVTVRVNWHELRILGIWAENWGNQLDRSDQSGPGDSGLAVNAIARRLEAQHPDKPPLTLTAEIRQLQEQYPGAELRTESGEIIVPRRDEEEPS